MRTASITLFATLLVCQLAVAQVTVKVDAATNVLMGEQTDISGNMFGITAFEGFPSVIADMDYRAAVQALRPGCFRFGGGIGWFAPKEDDPSWYDGPQAKREFEQTLLFGSRYAFGRFPPIVRNMGAQSMVSLGNPPPYLTQEGTRHPSDFDKWADYCARYVGLWKHFDPDLRLVQVWNEPNASWFRDPRANDKGTSAADLHIQMANKVARAIKGRFPDIQIGGPVLCWPPGWPPNQTGQKPWYTWQSWTLPWLQNTADTVDFFDFHVYDVAPQDFAVQTEMTYNQALLTQGRKLPIWITESSYNLTDEEQKDTKAIWNKRLLPYERLLLRGMLPQTDKLAGNLYHDLHATHHTLLPGSAFDPDPMYWLLWILRDLRGPRVLSESDDPELLAYATMEQDRVSIVLFNDSDAAKQLDLDIAMPTGYATGPHTRAIGDGGDGTCQRLSIEAETTRNGGRMSVQFELPAFATTCMNFHMQNFGAVSRALVRREFFGDKTVQFVDAGTPANLQIELPTLQADKAWLRVGLLGPEGEEKLAVHLNDQTLAAQATALQDIPIDPASLKATNAVRVTLAAPAGNPKLAVGFVSIIAEHTEPVSR